ncbi:oxygen-independent coproporphyrinogen III oxidase [uncultured Jannaschia sp.]|uniref:oxygen-independent coproporphyrinogen III oxidase n=1 Tax=uncultured Jannaschia sp. TaxID=293347 RepID=UPI0026181046|nr:oxygen-independent coproporphyrinogen III oxidase [uncultured Jannaschia sp.]
MGQVEAMTRQMLDIRAIEARAPRYTSYPPATRFHDGVGPDAALGWLGAVPPGSRISLYVHIPFCRRLCWFCACRTQGTRSTAPLLSYLDALEDEIALIADALPPDVTVAHLHLGGGTPTLLPAEAMARLFAMLEARFPRAPGAEVSVEVDPTELDAARLDALAEAGLTRASLGVQDFDSAVQAAIGRPQSFAQTAAAVNGLRARGISAINLDLLYGLPHQSVKTIDRTLDQALSLIPDRVALYGYAHVPWASKRQVMIEADALPDAHARLELARRAADRMREAGYAAVGIDHFARPADPMAIAARAGTLRRNFQGYTTDRAEVLIGLGASSISRLPQGYLQNAARTGDWKARVQRGRPAVARGYALTNRDRLVGEVIERLLCDFAVDPTAFPDRQSVAELTARAALHWPEAVIRTRTGALRIRDEALHLARMVALAMDAEPVPTGRHSTAI